MNKQSTPPKTKKKILVADDDPAIVDALKQILEDEGYEVITSVNGSTVGKTQEHLPNLLLLDIWMSGVDGREVCRELKGNAKTKYIPIIMISANKDTEGIAKEAGADDFIAKPFEMDDLLAMVEKYVKEGVKTDG